VSAIAMIISLSLMAIAMSSAASPLELAAESPFELAAENVKSIFSSKEYAEVFLLLFVLQSALDYISVIKARVIMRKIVQVDLKYKNLLFLCADAAATILLLTAYNHSFSALTLYFLTGYLSFLSFIFLEFAFYGTTFLIFFVTLMYVLALWSLSAVRSVPVLSFVLWILPVRTLPIRSIGLMSGILLFLSLGLFGLLGQLSNLSFLFPWF
jgi:hypothetical protein